MLVTTFARGCLGACFLVAMDIPLDKLFVESKIIKIKVYFESNGCFSEGLLEISQLVHQG
jgi:hypothetical protein